MMMCYAKALQRRVICIFTYEAKSIMYNANLHHELWTKKFRYQACIFFLVRVKIPEILIDNIMLKCTGTQVRLFSYQATWWRFLHQLYFLFKVKLIIKSQESVGVACTIKRKTTPCNIIIFWNKNSLGKCIHSEHILHSLIWDFYWFYEVIIIITTHTVH